MPEYERNLVLVHSPGLQARSDFDAIKTRLSDRAPDIEVFIVENGVPQSVTRHHASRRPTLIFSPVEIRQLQWFRAKVYAGMRYPKIEELQRLVSAGVRVPDTVMLEPDTRLDPESWGPFTVLKPNIGRQGAGVRLWRTRDVRWVDPRSWPVDDPRFGHPLLAQRFVDTGSFATSYRVMTVFGRAVYSAVSQSTSPRSFDLDPTAVDPLDQPIASNIGERRFQLNFQADIIAYGMEVARALPDIPVLGVDIIREHVNGQLYALEVNPSGLTWHISSNYGLALQRKHGVDLNSQFGALDIIAEALIDMTRREAE